MVQRTIIFGVLANGKSKKKKLVKKLDYALTAQLNIFMSIFKCAIIYSFILQHFNANLNRFLRHRYCVIYYRKKKFHFFLLYNAKFLVKNRNWAEFGPISFYSFVQNRVTRCVYFAFCCRILKSCTIDYSLKGSQF